MFGPNLYVRKDGKTIKLRAPRKCEINSVVDGFCDFEVTKYLGRISGSTIQEEEKWFDKTADSEDDIVWGIEYEGRLIGITGIQDMHLCFNHAVTGVVTWEKELWGQGLVSMAHLARTWYASEVLNIHVLYSHVWSPNNASKNALQRVGYQVIGVDYFKKFFMGNWIDLIILQWINPRYADMFFANRPETKEIFSESIKRGALIMSIAKEVVSFK